MSCKVITDALSPEMLAPSASLYYTPRVRVDTLGGNADEAGHALLQFNRYGDDRPDELSK